MCTIIKVISLLAKRVFLVFDSVSLSLHHFKVNIFIHATDIHLNPIKEYEDDKVKVSLCICNCTNVPIEQEGINLVTGNKQQQSKLHHLAIHIRLPLGVISNHALRCRLEEFKHNTMKRTNKLQENSQNIISSDHLGHRWLFCLAIKKII